MLSLSKVLMSIRCWMVSCSTLCTLLSESRTCRVSLRICPIYSLLNSTNTGIMPTITKASTLSIEKRYKNAPTNIATTEMVLGIVSVRKLTTVPTSCSNLLRTSPEWCDSFPVHSDRKIRSSMRCCIRFCALIPKMLRTQMEQMRRAKPQRTSNAITPTDQ